MENNSAPGKRKWRVNLFDVIIIAIVIIAAALFLYFTTFKSQPVAAPQTVEVTYQLELRDLSASVAELIEPGDSLTEITKNQALGTIQTVEIIPYTGLAQDHETGNYILSEIPDRYTAMLTVTATATETDSAITTTSGYVLRCGTGAAIRGPGYGGSGTVLTIERGN